MTTYRISNECSINLCVMWCSFGSWPRNKMNRHGLIHPSFLTIGHILHFVVPFSPFFITISMQNIRVIKFILLCVQTSLRYLLIFTFDIQRIAKMLFVLTKKICCVSSSPQTKQNFLRTCVKMFFSNDIIF